MEDKDFIKFITDRDDKFLRHIDSSVDSASENIFARVKTLMLEQARDTTKSLSEVNLTISNINNELKSLQSKSLILFKTHDDLKDVHVPKMKANEAQIRYLEENYNGIKKDQDDTEKRIKNLEVIAEASKNTKKGMYYIWRIGFGGMAAIAFLKSMWSFFQ